MRADRDPRHLPEWIQREADAIVAADRRRSRQRTATIVALAVAAGAAVLRALLMVV